MENVKVTVEEPSSVKRKIAVEVPAEAASALCSLEVSRSRDDSFRLFLDDAVLTGAIFTDGFESGDLTGWSSALP